MSRVWKFDLISKRLSTMPAVREEGVITVTSKPYPAIVVDGLAVSADVVSGKLYEPPKPMDELDLSAEIVGATLRAPLYQYTLWASEGLNLSAEIADVTLRTILSSYPHWVAEGFDAWAEVMAGSLQTVLITYQSWPFEALDMSAEVVGATLT